MRHIDKGSEPEYLTEHKDKWLEAFLENIKMHPNDKKYKRPDSKKYAHPKIFDALWCASNGKCFYCECSLDGKNKEVDHFIEVAEREDLAFDWNNLNLSCDQCNNKCPNKDIPVDKVLDPCRDSDEEIQKCITFDCEVMHEVNNSEKGRQTIKKYKFNSQEQQYRRGKFLRDIMKLVFSMVKCNGVNSLTDKDKEQLRSLLYPTRPYSYMVEVYLKKQLPEIFN